MPIWRILINFVFRALIFSNRCVAHFESHTAIVHPQLIPSVMPEEPDYKALYEAAQASNLELQAENDRLLADNRLLNGRLRSAGQQVGILSEHLREMSAPLAEIIATFDQIKAANSTTASTEPPEKTPGG